MNGFVSKLPERIHPVLPKTMLYLNQVAALRSILMIMWALLNSVGIAWAQTHTIPRQHHDQVDSLYIQEVEDRLRPDKVLHAEPLYIDLIRDLGARKGEREWNVGLGLTDKLRYDAYQALVEYEWAPVDRLGLEVELPFTFYFNNESDVARPASQLDGLKTALQWSFYVSEQKQTTLALGYINEVLFASLSGNQRNQPLVRGNKFNPFLIGAKRWGTRFHTLVYTGPQAERSFRLAEWKTNWMLNTNLHYMIPGTRNFVGVEFNKELTGEAFQMVVRPQLRVGITDNLLVGIVTGIPTHKKEQRLSTFLRLIYEPTHRRVHIRS